MVTFVEPPIIASEWLGTIAPALRGTNNSGPRSPTMYALPLSTGPPSALTPAGIDEYVGLPPVNNEPKERTEVIEWFKNQRDAVLINTGCFTKGFDVCDVEVILMARATKSLSLWIQIAGRGARKTSKIEKPYFLLIDGGNNNEEHGIFSFERDWRKIFFDKQRKSFLKENSVPLLPFRTSFIIVYNAPDSILTKDCAFVKKIECKQIKSSQYLDWRISLRIN